jgi:hypothetical protein
MDAIEYEKQGFFIGAEATIKTSGLRVVLVSNPQTDITDGKTRVWVAMQFDTHVRYLAILDDLKLN